MLELKSHSLRATFSPLGARLVSLFVGDTDVVAGGGTDAEFVAGDWTAGAVCGRVAGRIRQARFSLDGRMVHLAPSEGENQLHGGPVNFGNTVWEHETGKNAVIFRKHSPDGDQGFPGAVDATASYALDGHVLSLELTAVTTRPTVVNLTNHAYWNLAGHGSGLDQIAAIDAHSFLPLDEFKLPTGEVRKVDGSRWDFRKPRRVAEAYDNAFILNGRRGEMKRALRLGDPASGRAMELHCTECCLQIYTADHWGPAMPGRHGPLMRHGAIALEAQNFPGAPNHANFPSAILRPGEVYRHRIEWRFS
ncbi:MAG: aldose epimerase family protein [Hyphomicrobiales bacterium]